MRYLFVSVFVLIPSLASSESWPVLRPIDALSAETLASAIWQSPTARALADDLDASNLIVHIESSWEMPSGIGGMTRFVISRGGHRYVRVTIDAKLPPAARVSLLAHELQHVREIAESDTGDMAGMRRLFHSCGAYSGYFETKAARQIEARVRTELGRSLQPKPVVEFHHQHLRARGAKAGAQVAER